MIGPDKSLAIITDKQFRATPTALILPHILRMIKASGFKEAEVFTGNGKVLGMDESQLRDKLGPESFALMDEMGIKVYQNEPFNDAEYTFLGVTKGDRRLFYSGLTGHNLIIRNGLVVHYGSGC